MWAVAAFLLFLQADYTTDGMKALDEGKYDAAVQAFRKAIEADAKDYFAHFNLAMAYTCCSAIRKPSPNTARRWNSSRGSTKPS
jgi:tetratricopeptide (TPR) repeat protein